MHTSVKLENMENHFNDILTIINSNQSIKRYLAYQSNNPLKVTADQPDITKSLIDDNIQLSFFNEDIVDGQKCFLFFNFLNSDLSKDTIGEETYLFDIVIPIGLWRLKGLNQFRAVRIAMEICSLLDQKSLTGIGEVKIKKAHSYKTNNSYQHLELLMTVGTSNMKKLR